MEFDYGELLDNGHSGFHNEIASNYTDFCEVDDFRHRAVGFNPITDKVIVLVEGYVSYEYLEA